MGLNDVKVPAEKEKLVANAQEEVDAVWNNYMMGLITDNERYNQVIDIWTRTNTLLTSTLMRQLEDDQQGFNSIYMMMHSGARGSREQIRQLGLWERSYEQALGSRDLFAMVTDGVPVFLALFTSVVHSCSRRRLSASRRSRPWPKPRECHRLRTTRLFSTARGRPARSRAGRRRRPTRLPGFTGAAWRSRVPGAGVP